MVSSSSADRSSDGRSAPRTPPSEVSNFSVPGNGSQAIEIVAHGDIVLNIKHTEDQTTLPHSFRVSSSVLKEHSKYFASLLQPGRFSEAGNVESTHKVLHEKYGNIAEAPVHELPTLNIEDLGRISVKSVGPLLTDFFLILHGLEVQPTPPVANLANLAIVADRFDALEVVRSHLRRKKTIRTLDAKTLARTDVALGEERVRQRLLVGLLLDYSPWVEKYSLRMISKGWVGSEVSTSAGLWWDLPSRLEEELAYRRDCILEAVQALQAHFLALYTSRDRQCKLGYDSSAQCDSFQLGEMMRFFGRIGTLQLRGTIIDVVEPSEPYAGDLTNLLDTLRQVPEYQIDKFHTHCGIRTRLVPLLDLLQKCINHAAICAECWQEHRAEYSWIGAKRPLVWKKSDSRLWEDGHGARHTGIRDLFTASERQWS